jgi:hypothetical protein
MNEWWMALDGYEKGMWLVTIPCTIVFLIQTALTIFLDIDGVEAEVEVDIDVDGDGDIGFAPFGLHIFSVRNGLSFLTIFGWSCIMFEDWGIWKIIHIPISFVLGTITVFLMAGLMKLMHSFASSGTYTLDEAVGVGASVVIKIPSGRKGTGNINVMIRGQLRELSAVSDEEISSNTRVEVTEVIGDNLLVAKK